MTEDNVKLRGYTAWSLMDNYEWAAGYTERYGMYWVNFTDPERTRLPKTSVSFYTNVVEANGFFRDLAEPWTYFATLYVLS